MIEDSDSAIIEAAAGKVADSYEVENRVHELVPAPLISVCIPTFQHRHFIEQCIESVLMQETDFPFEIIIGEDCSTDGTRELVLSYAKKFPDIIRVVTADYNVKQLANQVRCFKYSRGKYIAQCDGDDYWADPQKLQRQASFMEKNIDYSLCYHSYQMLRDGSLSQSLPLHGRDYSGPELIGLPPGITVGTKFFRNIYSGLDDQWIFKFNNDSSVTALLGTFGKCKFLSNIKPTVYRQHSQGKWSSKDQITKYHTLRYVRMKIYKRFLDIGDERSAMITLAALRNDLLNDKKLNALENYSFKADEKQISISFRRVWMIFHFYPLIRKIGRIKRLLNRK